MPVPTGFYASRISSELAWICSVIANPQVGYEDNKLTLTYWRLMAPSDEIVYYRRSIDEPGFLVAGDHRG